jgi:predicted peptidase
MKKLIHKEQKWEFSFIAYTPDDTSKKLPLVLQLHGAGERGDGQAELDLVEVHGFPKYLKTEAREDCIFVFPQCPKEIFWPAKVESILKFIDQIVEEFNVDEDRIYLTGLSMGGFGTWYTAMAKPQRFAAIAPVCGGGMPWNAAVLTMPVWAFHGACDPTVDVSYSDQMVEKIRAAGGNVKYSRYEGVGHDSWVQAYTRELLDWLLEQKR